MRGRTALVVIAASRALSASAIFVIFGATLHGVTRGRDPLALTPPFLAVFGATLVLAAVLRERGTVRQSAALTVVVLAAAVAWGLSLPARAPDVLAVLTRIVGFAIAGEIHLWRTLGVARGLQRWRDVRDDALFALAALAVAALLPLPFDRDALPALALVLIVTGAVALSVARSSEELSLTPGQVHGRPASGAATGTAFALGLLAVAAAFLLPAIQRLLGQAVDALAPPVGRLLFYLLLPLGYVAAYLVYLVQWLRDALFAGAFDWQPPQVPRLDPAIEAERIREIEQTRPLVIGAVEVIVALVGIAFAIALVFRLASERRALLPEGALLEREAVEGMGLGATLRALFPRAAPRAAMPADDGTAAAAVRRLYWRLLELAEREGPGRRDPPETPTEHRERLVVSSARWAPAEAVVTAFEELRYGEREPDAATVARARDALREVEAAR